MAPRYGAPAGVEQKGGLGVVGFSLIGFGSPTLSKRRGFGAERTGMNQRGVENVSF